MIELLVVVAIIAILVGIVIGVAGYASKKSSMASALTDLERIKSALEEYRIERGTYYPNFSGAINVGSFSNDVGRYLNGGFKVVDAWGNGYMYAPSITNGTPVRSYRLYSRGPSANAFDDVDSSSGAY